MSYPTINGDEPESEIVQMLGGQVAELIRGGTGFYEAMSAVVKHRYGGRFKKFYRQVQRHLSGRSAATRQQLKLAGM